MYMIEITEDKAMDLKEKAKKILKIGKEMYECIEELAEDSQMGERGGYGNRYGNRGDYSGGSSSGGSGGGYGNRYGNREYDDWDDDDDDFGERRGRSSRTGRFVRR